MMDKLRAANPDALIYVQHYNAEAKDLNAKTE
jgi:hypothetical protein